MPYQVYHFLAMIVSKLVKSWLRMINFSKIMLSGKNIFNVKMIPVYGNPLYLRNIIQPITACPSELCLLLLIYNRPTMSEKYWNNLFKYMIKFINLNKKYINNLVENILLPLLLQASISHLMIIYCCMSGQE